MIYKFLKEHFEKAISVKEILIRFGVDYTVDKSYIIVATFGGQQYFAMSDSIDNLIESVVPHFAKVDFNGNLYKLDMQNAVPISCSGEFNVKNWGIATE